MEITAETHYSRLTIFFVLIAALGIIGLWLALTPPGITGKADSIGYAICHRITVRSFIAGDYQLPLCARCTGIYLGAMTGLGVILASGRQRANRLPNWRINIVLGLFVIIMGIDGVNSYLTLFPGFEGIYPPHNRLRLLTGIFCGLTLINIVYPMFNQSIWDDHGVTTPALYNLKELAGLSLLAFLMAVLVLVENHTILFVLGLISAFGVLAVMTLIMTAGFVTTTNTFRTYRLWKELPVPLIAGLTMAIVLIGAVDWLRYAYTGTWAGFSF